MLPVSMEPQIQLVNSEYYTEDEVSAILHGIYKTINYKVAKDETVQKTILIDFFGTQKSMKTSVTVKLDQLFRRNKLKTYAPAETAEHLGIRSRNTDDPAIEQAKHLTGVENEVLYLAREPRSHVAIISRGPIDMLYWYERDLRKGLYSETHVRRVSERIYELLDAQLVDCFFFFTCSVETAMRREYDGALTKRQGSKMNPKDIAETIDIYKKVLADVEKNVPGLSIFHVDTSDMDLEQTGKEVLKYLLPTICSRFEVSEGRFMPYSPSLLQKRAKRSGYFEEQIKFRGHPSGELLAEHGWEFVRESYSEDTYLEKTDCVKTDPYGEVIRIRKEGDEFRFLYKGVSQDRLLSHRRPYTVVIDKEEAERIMSAYRQIIALKKRRKHFQKTGSTGDGHFFTLHMDSIEGLGNFTEIRARGSSDQTHTEEMLKLGEDLQFRISSQIEGNYLALALRKK